MKISGQAMLIVGFGAAALALLQATTRTLLAAPSGGVLAVVDTMELQKNYTAFKDEVSSFQRFQEDKGKSFDVRQFLNAAEWDELDALEGKKNLKAEETKRLTELRGQTDLRKKAIRELGSKPDQSDKDKEELKRLNDIPRANQVRLEELQDKLVQEIQKEQARLTEKLRKSLTEAYDRLAKDKGIALILDKKDVQWSAASIEITQDVLNRLNRK